MENNQRSYVSLIYKYADNETKKNLKLVSKAFWECHKKEKFENNYVKSQEDHHTQLYCFGNCPNTDLYEVSVSLWTRINRF